MEKVLRITQIKSAIKRQSVQRQTLEALGIRRIRHTVEQKDTPQLRGMLAKVAHLVIVQEA